MKHAIQISSTIIVDVTDKVRARTYNCEYGFYSAVFWFLNTAKYRASPTKELKSRGVETIALFMIIM